MSDQPDQSWHPSALMEAVWQRDVVGPMEDFQDPRGGGPGGSNRRKVVPRGQKDVEMSGGSDESY